MAPAGLILRLAFVGMLLCLTVVALGAYVRLTDAGLGCPDWPTCYGHLAPAGATNESADAQFPGGQFDSGKAWREMIHRYAAAALGLVIVVIAALGIVYRQERVVSVPFVIALLCTVLFQGALGALTVWWLVKPLVVVLHLLGGLSTLALLTWLWLTMRRRTGVVPFSGDATATGALDGARRLAAIGIVALGLQIALGGWTSSNYAAFSCPDFPRCQDQWWPANMDFQDAFVLWRGLDVNYTGGVLEHPARVAIHFTHRLGAIVATLALCIAALVTLRRAPTALLRHGALWIFAALALQLSLGILMVLRGFPLGLATAHNAGAALLLVAAITLNRRLREP